MKYFNSEFVEVDQLLVYQRWQTSGLCGSPSRSQVGVSDENEELVYTVQPILRHRDDWIVCSRGV